jgi:hypothetical protein
MKLPIVILAAAALWSCGAEAKTVSIRFVGFCNGLDITTARDKPVVKSVENGCAAGHGGGVGVLGDLKRYSGSYYAIGENYDDGAGHYIGEEFWVVSAPLVIGGTYEGWRHKSDGRLIKFGSGTYSVISSPSKPLGGKRLIAH